MRRFQGERVASIMGRLKIPEEVPIEHKMVTGAVERAQGGRWRRRTSRSEKNVLKYDEVMNLQRERIYDWRNDILVKEETSGLVSRWMEQAIGGVVNRRVRSRWPPANGTGRNSTGNWRSITRAAWRPTARRAGSPVEDVSRLGAQSRSGGAPTGERVAELGSRAVIEAVERSVMLSVIDNKWARAPGRDGLPAVGNRPCGPMGQRDPLTEYQREGLRSVRRDGGPR